METIYKSDDYRQSLKHSLIQQKQRLGRALSFQKMADHCRVQKTYLSKILNHGGNLTQDQLYLACDYLALKEAETEFLLTLHEIDGTYLPARQKKLKEKLEKMRAQYLKTEAHIDSRTTEVPAQDLQLFYLDPLMQVIHVMLTIEKYAKEPRTIGKAMGLSEAVVTEKIKTLERIKFIQSVSGGYKVINNDLHLSADSEIFNAYRKLLRIAALNRLDQIDPKKSYSLSVILSSTPEVRAEIQVQFLNFLNKVKKLVSAGEEREVYQLNFDLFDWT